MSTRLRTALREAADSAPPFDLTTDPWARGRRVRRRRQIQVVGALVGAGMLVAALVLGGVPQLSSDAPPPAGPTPTEATLPDRLFDAPRDIPDLRDDPLGGPAAVVYWGAAPIRTGLWSTSSYIPLVVGAERDVVRAVRELDGRGDRVALSPDGTRLAASADSYPDPDDGPSVLITDLVSGRTERFEVPDLPSGGSIERLTWAPDSRELLVQVAVVTQWLDEGAYRADDRDAVLDSHAGEWRIRAHGTPLAVSRDGRLELRWAGDYGDLVVARSDGPAQATLEMSTPELLVEGLAVGAHQAAAFSPDGESVAVWAVGDDNVPPDGYNPHSLEVFATTTGSHLGTVELGGLGGGSLLGWGETGLLGLIPHSDRGTRFVRFDVSDLPEVSSETIVRQVHTSTEIAVWSALVPTVFLDADVRTAEPPSARFTWVPWIPWLLGGAVLVVVLVGLYQVRRRRLAR
ncbi:hypothetical protein [Phytoactinopolyspora limicola]|uniref:hypothetical protein n=1 Tax=Phytoactinopolyspora limicola TaxID=2715536 RepID=UPI001409DE5D|nr:hypothetical protein [Phytoactinopolyspora limicola]